MQLSGISIITLARNDSKLVQTMTNTKQIQTKKISFILALSVIIYAAIDTYLFLCHDINIMRITTPVILGLVIAIILCGLLHKFFYNWLTKNPIHFSFGEPSTPIVKSESIIELFGCY